ncbi:MAG: chlorite dismutase family protein [Candidatus Nitrosocaldus sp.]|nr:chlorite dismutase family protein [Candidatus Nitrosocaldus sp.]
MSNVGSEAPQHTFFNFSFFKVDQKWRWLNDVTKQESAKEFISILESASASVDGVRYRSYSLVGLREDADFMLWFLSDSIEKVQGIVARLYRTVLGKYINPAYVYISVLKPSTYTGRAESSFLKGEKPLKYVIVYPFIKSREWYLLPFEERRRMMEEHAMVGRRFPTVRLNTSYSFGLDDQDFMLAFETDDIYAFHELVMQLRETQVSRYVVKDTPMLVSIYKPIGEVISDLG